MKSQKKKKEAPQSTGLLKEFSTSPDMKKSKVPDQRRWMLAGSLDFYKDNFWGRTPFSDRYRLLSDKGHFNRFCLELNLAEGDAFKIAVISEEGIWDNGATAGFGTLKGGKSYFFAGETDGFDANIRVRSAGRYRLTLQVDSFDLGCFSLSARRLGKPTEEAFLLEESEGNQGAFYLVGSCGNGRWAEDATEENRDYCLHYEKGKYTLNVCLKENETVPWAKGFVACKIAFGKNGRVASNGWFGDREGKNLLLLPGKYRISLDLQTGLVCAEPLEDEAEYCTKDRR